MVNGTMKRRIEPSRKERLADKLDRLRDPLLPDRPKPAPKRIVADGDLPRWDYSHPEVES